MIYKLTENKLHTACGVNWLNLISIGSSASSPSLTSFTDMMSCSLCTHVESWTLRIGGAVLPMGRRRTRLYLDKNGAGSIGGFCEVQD